MRLTREIYLKVNQYTDTYLNRILSLENPVATLNQFNYVLAAQNIQNALIEKGNLSGEVVKTISTSEFLEEIKDYIFKRIPAAYLASKNEGMTVEIAEAFIRDKGSHFFEELKPLTNYVITGLKPYNYPATESQKKYIRDLGGHIYHEEQLTGREANEIIKAIKVKTRTKPFYFGYFTGEYDNGKKDI